ncbi:MAG TPA: hopanoid-associated sugar epimerase [Gammaproteobacteria bacterium]|jgi:dihydroflavonol-4-reductase|nr:hopanoid-associated sugar epimerase [Gammaproteobacteria bacterium]
MSGPKLVTGANGFLGAAVVRALLAAGEPVRAFVRPGSDRRNLAGLTVEIAEGDLVSRASLDPAVRGCTGVYHVAADYRLWVADPKPMYRTNVEGSVNVLDAAAAAGVPRVVYTSSVAVLGIRSDRTPADEETPVSVGQMIGHYKRSKFLAEKAVRARARELALDVVTVNPSTPIGPGDVRPTPTGRILLDAAAGRMPAFVDTGLNLVDVDDCARGHLLAFAAGKTGERYILGGRDFTLREILEVVAAHVGRRAPKIRLPHWLVYPLAVGAEGVATITRREPRVTLDGVRMSTKHMYFSSRKAERELGYRWRDPRLAIAAAIDWFKRNEYF